MGRVFICGFFNFPRGGAASNYVQYLSKVFIGLGKQVVLITNKNLEYINQSSYQGIQIEPIELRKDKIGHYLDFNFRIGFYIKLALEKHMPDRGDIVIAYSRDSSVLDSVLRCGSQTGAQTGVCLVEWFEKGDYDKGYFDINYWKELIAFYIKNKKFDYIFPISTYIDDFYRKKGCNTFCIPCLADTSEFEYTGKQITSKRIFIFPGNGKMKDALSEMLLAFSLLEDSEKEKLEFHICGISNYANKMLKDTALEKYVGASIIIHDWMKYEELIALYQKAHFLLLARSISRMTRANFPSKIPETLSYGIIPICSRVGDYTEYYLEDGKNSLIMDGCDTNTVALGIRRALKLKDDEMKNMSFHCRKTAEDKFDYRRWIMPMSDALHNLT